MMEDHNKMNREDPSDTQIFKDRIKAWRTERGEQSTYLGVEKDFFLFNCLRLTR